MKIEKTLFKLSILETFLFLGLMLILFNGVIFIFTLITGNPRLLVYDTSWILQFVFPFIYSIIHTSTNRNGILKLTMYNDSKTLIEKIESLILKKEYVTIQSENKGVIFVKKTQWSRFFNYFFRENIILRVTEDEVKIFAKKNLLDSLEMKLKY